MKLTYSFLLSFVTCILSVNAQTENMDFEFGNFNNWILDTGTRQTPEIVDWNPRPAPDLNTQIELTTPASPQFDAIGLNCAPTAVNIPSVFPGGSFSTLLGNLEGGRRAARISRTFTVTPQETILQYSYAVIMDDPGHTQEQQPKFVVNIRNVNGEIVTCGKFEAFAGADALANGFVNCDSGSGSILSANLQILPWTTAAADLTPFIGQQITIEFITLDCMLNAHGGYAYVEANINELQIDVVGLCNVGLNDVTLTAPLGFDSYLWSTGDITRSINVTGTQFGDSYSVDLISNTGCNTSASITLAPVDPATINPIEDQEICKGGSITLSPTGENIGDFLFPELNTSGTVAVASPTQDTTYTIIARDENGCEGASTTVNILVFESDLPAFPNADFEIAPVFTNTSFPCNTVQFNNLSAYCKNDLTYLWNFGDGTTSTEENPLHIFPEVIDDEAIEYFITLTATSLIDEISDVFSLSYQNSTITPSFSTFQVSSCSPLIISNTSNICDATSIADFPSFTYTWNFGDGEPEFITDSTTNSFDYNYNASGTYTITLSITDQNNNSFTVPSFSDEVNINIDSSANFDFDINCFETQFTNRSVTCNPNITYLWDFGDGSPTNSLEDPLHRFLTIGPHNVTLTINDGTMDYSIQKEVLLTPDATIPDFDFNIDCNNVAFFDRTNSCKNLNHTWDFGDDSALNIFQNPTHQYSSEGIYTVTLIINDGPDEFFINKTVTIENEFDYVTPENLTQCVDNSVINPTKATFNLLEQSNRILANVNPNGVFYPEVTYHLNELDAFSNSQRQNVLFENSENPQTLFARVADSRGCIEVFPFSVAAVNPPILSTIENILLCFAEQNSLNYNLRQLDEQFFDNFNFLNETDLNYFTNQNDADLNINNIENITLQPGIDTSIYVRAEKKDSPTSCFSTSNFLIRLDDETTDLSGRCTPLFANTMTPNSDGANDYFYIKNIETYPNNEIVIYNRWGNIVYQTKGYNNKWDGTHKGKKLPVGNYYYIVNFNNSSNTSHTGYVTILR